MSITNFIFFSINFLFHNTKFIHQFDKLKFYENKFIMEGTHKLKK